MAIYIVETREVWIQPIKVKACSPKEALERILEGEGTIIEDRFEFSHLLDPEFWLVSREGGKKIRVRRFS